MKVKQLGFEGIIERFCDGDTVIVIVNIAGSDIWQRKRVRIVGIESWELDTDDHEKAVRCRDELTAKFRGMFCRVITANNSLDKYGRLVAEIYFDDEDKLTHYLIGAQYAWQTDEFKQSASRCR